MRIVTRPLALIALTCALPALASAEGSAQGVQVMRGGKIDMGNATAETKTAAKAAPECKTLTTGDTFCKVATTNGTARWVLQGQMEPEFSVGDEFPVYQHSMLLNLRRYDLPIVTGAWRYYRVRGVIYKVGAEDHKVMEVIGRTARR